MLNKFKNLDYPVLGILICFMAASTMIIFSATSGTKYNGLHINNLVTFALLFIVMLGISLIDYRIWVRYLPYALYGLGIALLLFVMFKGMTINNSKRWINLHFVLFQPSELMKVFVILVVAKLLAKRKGEPLRFFHDLVPIGLIVVVPFLFVLQQPDMGTSIVFVAIFLGMLWVGNVRKLHALAGIISFAVIIASLTGLYFYKFDLFSKIIKPHQLHRIQTFLDPASDPDQSWHVMNSKIAIASGQLYGEGFKSGHFVQKGYIPYDYADSIFVVIGEELGFVGAAALLLFYFLLIYRMIIIAMDCKNLAGSYMIVGVVSMLTLQIFENIAMHIGLMPLSGIALPFISYGGSSLLTNMIAMGLVLSVKMHPHSHLDIE